MVTTASPVASFPLSVSIACIAAVKAVVLAITTWLLGPHAMIPYLLLASLRRALFLGSLLPSLSLSTFPRT